ncbi:MAG: ribonuclease III [Prevotellaceae bacterium]|nr:ribonuclease III [Prevotellaceae bacterium]
MKNFIDRVKLAFHKDRQFYSSLYKILGFYPHKIEYYHIALAHSSKGYRTKHGQKLNNERLEYLGDAVLETVVSDILFHKYPNQREGFLSSTRSKLVQRSMLGRLAKDMGIERLITTKGHQNAHNSYLGGNAFEALVGAVYLDRGFDYCQKFVRQRILDSMVNVDDVARRETNFKSRLLEWCQKNKLACEFKLVEQTNEAHNAPHFTTSVEIEGLEVERGNGYSRKESEQTAARNALILLRADAQTEDKVYAVVEARTAMEAPRICAVPRIPELEQAVQKLRTELKRKRAKGEQPAATAAEAKEKTARSQQNADERKKNDDDNRKILADEADTALQPAAGEPTAASDIQSESETPQSTAGAESETNAEGENTSATKKRRRRGGRKHKKSSATSETIQPDETLGEDNTGDTLPETENAISEPANNAETTADKQPEPEENPVHLTKKQSNTKERSSEDSEKSETIAVSAGEAAAQSEPHAPDTPQTAEKAGTPDENPDIAATTSETPANETAVAATIAEKPAPEAKETADNVETSRPTAQPRRRKSRTAAQSAALSADSSATGAPESEPAAKNSETASVAGETVPSPAGEAADAADQAAAKPAKRKRGRPRKAAAQLADEAQAAPTAAESTTSAAEPDAKPANGSSTDEKAQQSQAEHHTASAEANAAAAVEEKAAENRLTKTGNARKSQTKAETTASDGKSTTENHLAAAAVTGAVTDNTPPDQTDADEQAAARPQRKSRRRTAARKAPAPPADMNPQP